MIWPLYCLYILCVGFVRVYKWIELQILRLFSPISRKIAKHQAEKLGLVLHCPGDPDTEWTKADDKRILSKCSKYNKIIHLDVHDNDFFPRLANKCFETVGDTYVDKGLEVRGDLENASEAIKRLIEGNVLNIYYHWWNRFLEWLELYAFNLQTRERAFQVGVEHYDLGNELFETMLDPWMQYTCGYWKDAEDLNAAQINKMELIAKKLDLKPGMRVLDIGCGWGTLCKYLSENYKVECVGVTIGEKGAEYGRKLCKGLNVDIRVQDYREVNEQFDRIVSVGMFEHVGFYNYREYMTVARRCLKDDGLVLLHTIGLSHNGVFPRKSDPFTHKHIFPNGNLPDPMDITNATNGLFIIEDWHNFGQDYAKTLFCWRENFVKSWPQLKDKYGERFYRLWTLYLSAARSLFSSRKLQLWQIVLSKDGLQREYRAAR